MPFGVVTLAGGAGEGGLTWSPYNHIEFPRFDACTNGSLPDRPWNPYCFDVSQDWAAGFRTAQTGGYGFAPNAALPNVFVGQNYDQGEPCMCDEALTYPDGCWASGACYGWGPYSRNLSWNYENSWIHPRVKHIVGERLAQAKLLKQAAAVRHELRRRERRGGHRHVVPREHLAGPVIVAIPCGLRIGLQRLQQRIIGPLGKRRKCGGGGLCCRPCGRTCCRRGCGPCCRHGCRHGYRQGCGHGCRPWSGGC